MKNKWYLIVALGVIVTVVTMTLQIPNGLGGYTNLGDVVVVFAALLLGKYGGALAGGIGSATADLILGYGVFAPITFISKGLEGYVCGLASGKKGVVFHLIPLAGVVVMVGGYFIGEIFLPSMGYAAAFAELLPNSVQALVGYVGGKALFELYNRVFAK